MGYCRFVACCHGLTAWILRASVAIVQDWNRFLLFFPGPLQELLATRFGFLLARGFLQSFWDNVIRKGQMFLRTTFEAFAIGLFSHISFQLMTTTYGLSPFSLAHNPVASTAEE